MRKLFRMNPAATSLIAAAALAVLVGGPAAMAQTGSPGAANKSSTPREAPVGHRQPRADQVPSEKNLGDPNDPLTKENAALDRKLKSICRGC
jgi:hypothetical protein